MNVVLTYARRDGFVEVPLWDTIAAVLAASESEAANDDNAGGDGIARVAQAAVEETGIDVSREKSLG